MFWVFCRDGCCELCEQRLFPFLISDAEIPSALVASEALALAMMELVTQPAVVKTARDELNQRRSGKPSPPLVGAFHTFTCDPNSFWNNTWNEPLTIEEAGDNRSNQ